MKASVSENYYFKYWQTMMERYGNDHKNDADLEKQLERAMSLYKDLPEIAVGVVKQVEAENIAKHCKERMIKRMGIIKDIESGKASLGYTNESQEVRARYELRQGFEFTCLALREFKKKYNIT